MNHRALIAMWIGIGLLTLCWLYPPWRDHPPSSQFRFFLEPPEWNRLHVEKLVLLDLIIGSITAGSMATLWKR